MLSITVPVAATTSSLFFPLIIADCEWKMKSINKPVDNRSSTSCHHCPDATLFVEDCQFQRCTTLSIKIGNVSLLLYDMRYM